MCGIGGWIGRGAQGPPADAWKALCESLALRGPEATHEFQAQGLCLVRTRLRTTGGEADDAVPLSASGRYALALNGEVWDSGAAEAGEDSRWLLERIDAEGVEALLRCNGTFAALLYDAQTDEVHLYRDPSGVRPLYWTDQGPGGSLLVASSIAALHAAGVPLAPDPESCTELFALQFWRPGRTPWRGVHAVSPGQRQGLRLSGGRPGAVGGSVTSPSEAPSLAAGTASSAFSSPLPLSELARLRDEAVHAELRTPRRTGFTLSGGLDSSAVATLAARLRPEREVVAAVGWFPGGPRAHDERPHARAVAGQLGWPLLEVAITPERWAQALPATVSALGGAIAGPGAVSQWVVAQALREAGVSVVVSGQGGDELFGGYERTRRLLARDDGLTLAPAPGYERLLAVDEPDPVRALLFRGRELLPFARPELAAALRGSAERLLPAPGPHLAQRAQAFEDAWLLPGLLQVEDATVSGQGMAGRVPLLHGPFAEAVRSWPLRERSPPRQPRWLFRELFGAELPTAVAARRDKVGFALPLEAWWAGPLRERVARLPGAEHFAALGFEAEALEAALREGAGLGARSRWFVLACGLAFERFAK